MSKFLYPIYKLKTKSYIKWWLYHKKAGGSGILSEILHGFSFNLANTLNRKFNLFEIQGNSVQDGSPSPDNEVPIKSAGDNGTINEKIQHGNEFDKSKVLQNYELLSTDGLASAKPGWYVSDYMVVEENKPYYLSGNKTSGNANCFYDKDKKFISTIRATTNAEIIAPQGARYLRTNGLLSELDNNISIRLNEEQDYSIPVQQPMRSIGDVRDCFINVNGNWYERHYIGELILNGSESNWYKSSNTTVDRFIYATNQFLQNNLSLCNYFKYSNDSSVKNYWYNNQDIQLCFNFSEPGTTTLEQWKEWLSTHNLKLIQPLAAPLDLPCTQSQINILENLPSTYKEMTIINSEDETPAYLKIQYYKEG